jgi:O-acetyl-ADP-ribose deacetylase (regulator of RNase III)
MIKIEIVRGDITKLTVDVIVNAANSSLLGGGGVDGAIHRGAGAELLNECKKIGFCASGDAVITGGYKLPCKHIIHTVGPVWRGGNNNVEETLASCYRKCLILASEYGLTSLAFPNISTGVYGFPKDKAVDVAIETVKKTLAELPNIEKVIFVCFDEENYKLYQEKLTKE